MSSAATTAPSGVHDHGRSYKAEAVFYAEIFGLLISLTILTVTLSYVNVGWALDLTGRAPNIVAGMLVAAVKSSLVLWFFMHMNHEGRLNRFIFAFALCLFTLAVVAFSSDFVWLHTYVVEGARAAVGGM